MERYALCTSDATSSGFFGNVVQQSKSCLAQAIGEASPQLAAARPDQNLQRAIGLPQLSHGTQNQD